MSNSHAGPSSPAGLELRTLPTLEQQLADRTHELQQSQQQLADRTLELQQSQQQLADRTQELQQSQQQLADRTQELQQLQQQLGNPNLRLEQIKKLLVVVISASLLVLVVVAVTLGVLYAKAKANSSPSVPPMNLTVSTWSSADTGPVSDSKLGAAAIMLGTMFAPPSSVGPESKVVFNGDNNKICVRVKTESLWHDTVQCVERANPLANSPLTMLDWIGGPSIYFFTADYLLSGIDYVPQNKSWRPSSIIQNKIRVHDQSQIASVTWLNGTSSWVYYQDLDEQIREIGLDDFRDLVWRDGSVGPLGLGGVGTGIGVSRWLNGTDEVEELFFQTRNGEIAGKIFKMDAWQPGYYAIEGTPGNIPDGASITVTTITEGVNSTILLAYVANSGFLNVQTRGATDLNYSGFSSPIQPVEGDGHSNIGLAAVGSLGVASVYFVKGQKILELSSQNSTGGNWTTVML